MWDFTADDTKSGRSVDLLDGKRLYRVICTDWIDRQRPIV